MKKTHTAKGWLVPDPRAPPIDGNGVLRPHGGSAGYWQATGPPGPNGRDVYHRGRELYPGPYPYQVWIIERGGGAGGIGLRI